MKLKGFFDLGGTNNDIIIYKTEYGYVARRHNPISAKRMATDPAFQRTRENAAAFGRAAKAAGLIRTALGDKLLLAKDNRLAGRLTSQMLKVINADTTSPRALRNVTNGNSELLEGFNFNAGSQLAGILKAPYEAMINRQTGQCTISLRSFVPVHVIKAPQDATHYRISALAAEIDFETGIVNSGTQETGFLPLNNLPSAAFSLESCLTPASKHPLFLALCIELVQITNQTTSQTTNKEYLPIKNGAFNSLALVKVCGRMKEE